MLLYNPIHNKIIYQQCQHGMSDGKVYTLDVDPGNGTLSYSSSHDVIPLVNRSIGAELYDYKRNRVYIGAATAADWHY